MIRRVARHDPARFDAVRAWPLRELFLAFLADEVVLAREAYHVDYLVWAILAPHRKRQEKPPAVPKILKGA